MCIFKDINYNVPVGHGLGGTQNDRCRNKMVACLSCQNHMTHTAANIEYPHLKVNYLAKDKSAGLD